MPRPARPAASLTRRAVAALVDLAFVTVAIASWLAILEYSLGARTSWVLVAGLCLYGFLLEGAFHGRTAGKAVVGIRVVERDGGPPSIGTAFARNALRALDILPLLPPYAVGGGVWLASGARHQRVGDLVAGTRVIRG